jgi:hypothetical protein
MGGGMKEIGLVGRAPGLRPTPSSACPRKPDRGVRRGRGRPPHTPRCGSIGLESCYLFPASVNAYSVSPAPTIMYCLPSSVHVEGPLLTLEVNR